MSINRLTSIPELIAQISPKPKRGKVAHTSYEAAVLNQMDATGVAETIAGATLRSIQGGVYEWHEEVGNALARHYTIQGFGSLHLVRDWSLLRKTCGAKHPALLNYDDMESVIFAYRKNRANDSTIRWFIVRIRSIYKALRLMKIVPQDCDPTSGIKIKSDPKGDPRPITFAQAKMLMTESDEPYREWFMFGCLAGLRAMEIANICGSWLEEGEPAPDGSAMWLLRIQGKGGTDKVIACHPALRDLILSKATQGRLYAIQPHYLSKMVNKEMRRMGVMTRNHNDKENNKSRISFHSTRHYFATALLAASNDIALVSKAMRHTDPRTTMIYAELNPVRQAAFVSSLFQTLDFDQITRQANPIEKDKK